MAPDSPTDKVAWRGQPQNPAAATPALPPEARVRPLPQWRLERVQALVENHCDEALSLADLAAAAGVSRMHFAAQFRAATGMRPHHYLLARRVFHAIAQLETGDAALADLALAVGFQSQSHFTTVFKRLTGTTPAAWRSSGRQTAHLA